MVYIDVYLSQTNWNPTQNSILVSSVRSSVLTMPKICLLWDPICQWFCLFPAVDVLLVHTWYLSMEQIFSCGAILLHMKICACFVEEKLLSLKSNFAPPHEYFCLSCGEKLPHILLYICIIMICAVDAKSVLLWFTLFWRKINPKVFSVEQNWQISCMSGLLVMGIR